MSASSADLERAVAPTTLSPTAEPPPFGETNVGAALALRRLLACVTVARVVTSLSLACAALLRTMDQPASG